MDSFDFNLYEELGLEPSCTDADVRSAYKKKALVHHPDRNGGVQSDEFLRLKQAYDVLIDGDKRRNYDAFHHTGEFKRDGRPLTAKEAAWLVDQQKRSWGVKEIHPFAVCILCDSCPCPADGVCDGCGMTYCQMCVRKMHCRGGMMPHYPLKTSNRLSEELRENGRKKEMEHKLLKGNSNQWMMFDEDFRMQRDVYKSRANREADEMVWYWAWGQTRYTVHVALWLASEDNDADIEFSVTEDGKQRMRVTPHGCPTLFDRVLAYEADTSRSGEAFTYGSMHCIAFCMLKRHPGQRWRQLFEGDSEGRRELPLGEPPHSVSEEQVDGFKPVHHYRVSGRMESASEWYEVVVNVPVPEATERKHLNVTLEGSRLKVGVAGWMEWERKIQPRTVRWQDKHESRTRVDMHNSTWLLTRDETRDFKCVQFVLSEWQEGANRSQEGDVRRQLEEDKSKILLEDADPFHMYDLVEAEMFLRAGAVFKARGQLRPKALELVEQMEKHMEDLASKGQTDEAWRESPFADVWEGEEDYVRRSQQQLVVRDEEGGEVEEAAEWWGAAALEEMEQWNQEAEEAEAEAELRRLSAKKFAAEQEERAAAAAAMKREEEEREKNLRRKEQALKNRELALKLAATMGEAAAAAEEAAGGKGLGGGGGAGGEEARRAAAAEAEKQKADKLAAALGIEQAREAAAAAARANPPAPKKIEAAPVARVGAAAAAVDVSTGGVVAAQQEGAAAAEEATAPPAKTASLAKCGWYFEDVDNALVKVTVPLEAACAGAALPKEGAVSCRFRDFNFVLEVSLNGCLHKLDVGELMFRIVPGESCVKVRPKAKKAIVELRKHNHGQPWNKLTAH